MTVEYVHRVRYVRKPLKIQKKYKNVKAKTKMRPVRLEKKRDSPSPRSFLKPVPIPTFQYFVTIKNSC